MGGGALEAGDPASHSWGRCMPILRTHHAAHLSSRLWGRFVRLWDSLACDDSLVQCRLYLLTAAGLWKSANNCKVRWCNWIVVYLNRWVKSSRPLFSRVTWQALGFKVPNLRHLKSDGFPQNFWEASPNWSNPNHWLITQKTLAPEPLSWGSFHSSSM